MKHRALIILLFLSCMISLHGQQNSTPTFPQEAKWYLHVSAPILSYSSDPNWMKTNFFQGYGLKAEYKSRNRLSYVFGVYRQNSDIKYVEQKRWHIRKSLGFKPVVRLYIDPYAKFFVSLGDEFKFCFEEKGEQNEVQSQRYWQNLIEIGVGYKIYLFKHKRFGIELFAGSNVVVLSNSELWTESLTNRGYKFDGSLFFVF